MILWRPRDFEGLGSSKGVFGKSRVQFDSSVIPVFTRMTEGNILHELCGLFRECGIGVVGDRMIRGIALIVRA